MRSTPPLILLTLLLPSCLAYSAPTTLDYTARSIAIALLEEGVDDVAQAKLRDIVAQDGRFAFDRVNLAIAHLKRGENDEASKELDAATRIDGSYSQIPYLKGLTTRRLRKFPEALEAFARAIAVNPRCREANFQMGLIHEWQDRSKDAVACFKKVIAPDSEQERIWPQFYGWSMYLGYKHLSILASGAGNEAEGERMASEAQAYAGLQAPQDTNLDFGPCASPIDPLDPKARTELARSKVALPGPRQPPPLEFVNAPWLTGQGPAPSSMAPLDWTTEGLSVLWTQDSLLKKRSAGWLPEKTSFPGTLLSGVDLCGDRHAEAVVRTPSGSLEIRDLSAGSTSVVALQAVTGVSAVVALDADQDGDLDLIVAGSRGAARGLWTFQNKTPPKEKRASLELSSGSCCGLTTATERLAVGLVAADLEEGNDLDVVAFFDQAPPIVFLSRRQGRFDRLQPAGPSGTGPGVAVDLNGDGFVDIAYPTRSGIALLANRGNGTFEPARIVELKTPLIETQAGDFDGDTLPDLLTRDSQGNLLLLASTPSFSFAPFSFAPLPLPGSPKVPSRPLIADLDGDGGLDIGLPGAGILYNRSASKSGFLRLSLEGTGGKSHARGIGSKVRIRVGTRLIRREIEHAGELFSLAGSSQADVVRVQWTNGIVSNRVTVLPDGSRTTAVPSGTTLTMVQPSGLSGSCPYLYADRGNGPEFVTDILAAAPLGLPSPDGALASTCPNELVLIPRTSWSEVRGQYRFRVTEEYREVTYLDFARLWVVDHDRSITVLPDSGMGTPPGEPRLLAFDTVQQPLRVTGSDGRDLTLVVARTDGHHFEPPADSIQGMAPEHFLEMALPPIAPGNRVFLVLEGFIYWTDAGINTRLAQLTPRAGSPLKLEVPDGAHGWRTVVPSVRFPAGRSKSATIEISGLVLPTDRRLRLVSSLRLYLDRISVASMPSSNPIQVRSRPVPTTEATLLFHGLTPLGPDPDRPPWFLISGERLDSLAGMWLIPRGDYTRFGPVEHLLREFDDLYVIMGPGDGVDIGFPVPSGPSGNLVRDLFLETAGYDKDAHPATHFSDRVEPLPYRGMPPYGLGSKFPPAIQDHLRRIQKPWNTRFRQGWGGACSDPHL